MTMQHLIMTGLAVIAALGLVALYWPKQKRALCFWCKRHQPVNSQYNPDDGFLWMCDACYVRTERDPAFLSWSRKEQEGRY